MTSEIVVVKVTLVELYIALVGAVIETLGLVESTLKATLSVSFKFPRVSFALTLTTFEPSLAVRTTEEQLKVVLVAQLSKEYAQESRLTSEILVTRVTLVEL